MKHKQNGGFLQWSIEQGNKTVNSEPVLTSEDKWKIVTSLLVVSLFAIMLYSLR